MYCPSKTSLAQSWILSPGTFWSAKKVGEDGQRKREKVQGLPVRALKASPSATGLAFALARGPLQEVLLGPGAQVQPEQV